MKRVDRNLITQLLMTLITGKLIPFQREVHKITCSDKYHNCHELNKKATKFLSWHILYHLKYPREEICSRRNCSSSDCALHYLLMGGVVTCNSQCHSRKRPCNCTVFLHQSNGEQDQSVKHYNHHPIQMPASII